MTTSAPPPPPRLPGKGPQGAGTLALWLLGAAAAFTALFFLITLVLRQMPEPVGQYADLFVEGAQMTLKLTLVSGLIGLLVGMIAGIMRSSPSALVRAPASFFIWLIRGTPLLVQILFVYNALPPLLKTIGINLLTPA